MGYILFSSTKKISIYTNCPSWNGIIEYSFDNNQWNEWRGDKIINHVIYMRGIRNTIISNNSNYSNWIVNGKKVKCQGNVENLLDYKSVINNRHPKMQDYCFSRMFVWCTSLIEAPLFLVSNFTDNCCRRMFDNCTSLTKPPMFPNLYIAKEAIINQHMLDNCPIKHISINNKLYDINVLKLL